MKPDAHKYRPSRRQNGRIGDHALRLFCEVLEDRTMLSTMDFTNPAGGLWGTAANWTNAAVPTDHHVPNSTDNAVIDVAGNVTVTYQGSQPTVENIENDDTLWVNGSSAGGTANLTMSQGMTNSGTILLESSSGGYQSSIATGSSTLTNLGTIQASLGSGGARIISGTLANQGSVSADNNDYLEITGTYQAQGGTTTGPAELYSCKLYETTSPAATSTIVIASTSDTLETDNLTGYTLWVNGSSLFNTDAILNLGGNVNNRGAILLESSNGAYQSNIATGSSTLTNLGTIQASLGSGGARIISGTLANQGSVSADNNDYLEITGTYQAQGGTTTGPAELYSCKLYETTSPAATSTIVIASTSDTLETDNLTGYTLWVNGSSLFNTDAILNLGGNVNNRGAILLESSNGAYQSNIATGSSTLTNLGTIQASLGSGGARIISGTLANQGSVSADNNDYLEITGTYQAQGGTTTGPAELYSCKLYETASPASASTIVVASTSDTLETDNLSGYTVWVNGSSLFNTDAILNLGANVNNRGAILLESSNGAYQSNIATGSSTLTNLGTIQASLGSGGARIISGTLANQGSVSADNNDYLEITGTYQAQGGTTTGPAELYSCKLYETTSPAATSTIVIASTSDTLETDNLTGYTLWVNGSSLFDTDAILNLGGNVNNRGAILLESSNGAYQSNIATGSSTLTNLGTIQASLGSGGARIISGTLANQGSVSADNNDYLEITGTYQAQGGTTTGPAELYSCKLYETASPASASTIVVASTSDTLETDNLSGYTVWVNGSSLFNTDAILNLGANVNNNGTILLQSSNGAYQSNIAAGSFTLTNAPGGTIQINPGSGGARSIGATSTLTSNLLTNPGAETGNLGGWTIGGTSNPTVDSGSFDPGINPHSGSYDFRGGTGASGTLTQNVPLVGTQGITAAAIDTGSLTAIVGFWEQGLNQGSPSDDAQVTLTFRNGSGTILSTASTPEVDSHNGTWQQYTSGVLIPVGTRSIDYTIQFIRHFGSDLDAFVDDTSLAVGGAAVVNNGTVNFDANTTLGAAGASFVNAGLMSIAGTTVTLVGAAFTNSVGGLVSGHGTFSTSGLTLTNNGIIDLSPPSILGVDLESSFLAITYYDATGMNAATVTNAANYTILGSGGDGIFGNGNDVNRSAAISGVTYNASTETAFVQFSSALPNDFYRVQVNGSAVQNAAGTQLLAGTQDQVNRVLGAVSALATVNLDPASDSGASNSDGITNVKTPTFDVQVNQAGTIQMDFDGNGTIDATLSVQIAGEYPFTAPTLADGSYLATVHFTAANGSSDVTTTAFTIDTKALSVVPQASGPGTALHFDGVNDYVPVGNLGARPSQGTISFWMEADVVQSYRNVLTTGPVTSDGTNGNQGIRFEEFTGGEFGAVIGSDTANSTSGFTGHSYTENLQVGTWYNVALTWDSTTNRVEGYLNGVLAFNDSNTTWPSNFANLTFGVGWSTSRYWEGDIDDVQLWDIQRSAAQIQTDMSIPLTGTETGLIGYWRFDEGSGDYITDTSGHVPNAILGGGNSAQSPTWVPSGASITSSIEVAPLTSRTVVFSEAVDPATISTSDFVLEEPGNAGSEPITSLSGSGATWTVGFASITTPGLYTLLVGPQIADIAGNEFDGNGNGIQGEPTDAGRDLFNLVLSASVSLTMDPASDSGASSDDGITNVTDPTFDVTANQAGTITIDFDGNGTTDATVNLPAAGTYQVAAGNLGDGTYTAEVNFQTDTGQAAQATTTYTIDTVGAHVTSMTPSGTIGTSASDVMVTFSEPVDLNTFIPSAITFTGPGGPISVNQPQLVSGSTYAIGFAVQAASGAYALTIAPSVTDLAGNKLDQNQNGINGEPSDSFTGSFTENLPVGGPITLNTPALGFIPANMVDDWTFFGRAGQTITTVVSPSAPATVVSPPPLNYAQVSLVDSSNNVLGTVSNMQIGTTATLASITLPADGVYHVEIQAPAGEPGITGFYDLTVADATVHQMPLIVNETETGQLLDSFSSDQWTFSTTANQQVQLNQVVASNSGIEFDLTGPNGYTAFRGLTTGSGEIDLPFTGTYTLTVHTVGQPGGYGFELDQASQIALSLNSPYHVPLAGSGQSQLFEVTMTAANPLEIALTDANPLDHNEVYVSYGQLPTRDSYDDRFTGGAAPDQTVALTAKPGTYYILVYNNLVNAAGTYTIEADSEPFLLSGLTPGKVGNADDTTLQFSGVFPLATSNGGYVISDAPTVQLIAQNGTVIPATPLPLKPPPFGTLGDQSSGVNPDGTMTVTAILPGGVILPGTYSVRVTDNTGYSQALSKRAHRRSGWSRDPQDQCDRPEPHRLPRSSHDLRPVHEHRRCAPRGPDPGAVGNAERCRRRADDTRRIQDRLRLLDHSHARRLQPVRGVPCEWLRPRHPPARRERDCAGLLRRLARKPMGLLASANRFQPGGARQHQHSNDRLGFAREQPAAALHQPGSLGRTLSRSYVRARFHVGRLRQ